MSLIHGPNLMARLDALATHSEQEDALTRLFLTPEHRAAADQVAAWMAEAGMAVSFDAMGTVVGRFEGTRPGLPALLLGSHIDTVRDAGRFDGALGVLAAIACVAALNNADERLPFAIEVLAFGDEEGVRFPTSLSSSLAVAGTLDPAVLDCRDDAGVTMANALRTFGGNPDTLAGVARQPDAVIGYLELHIEQGPVLEAEDLPIGVVTAINGANRYSVSVTGTAGHAGTVPMALRRDALAGAAEMVLAVEANARAVPDLVATVGRLAPMPGAVNVIPGEVRFTIDLRAPDDAIRHEARAALIAEIEAISERRGLACAITQMSDQPACACAPSLIELLDASIQRQGLTSRRLASGAGHDAMAIASLCPVGMLFLRCKGGISHNPAESITECDADVAVAVLLDAVRNFRES